MWSTVTDTKPRWNKRTIATLLAFPPESQRRVTAREDQESVQGKACFQITAPSSCYRRSDGCQVLSPMILYALVRERGAVFVELPWDRCPFRCSDRTDDG
jgi:hypothetical protein